jgi:hypothetical protein
MTATDAALKMMKQRGYVVVACLGEQLPEDEPAVGNTLDKFAGCFLPCYLLEITEPTDRADWEAQVLAIFGKPKRPLNGDDLTATFWRCKLIDDEGEDAA